jgi:chromosome segregation ATPase
MMDQEPNEVLNNLKGQITELISLYQKSKQEKESLIHEKLELMEKVEILKREREEFSHQYNTLKLAKTFTANSGDSQEAKVKINRIVREIDKCIALLNR